MTGLDPRLTDPEAARHVARARAGAPAIPPARDAALLARMRANPSWVRLPDDDRVATIDGVLAGGPPLAYRVYRPRAGFAGTLLFAHGGGWATGNLETNDGLCRELARHTGTQVVSVDYRLAPEHPYPAALDDMTRALEVLAAGGDGLVPDPAALGVAGHSSGGNLAAALALRSRAGRAPAIRHQLLLCPVLDCDFERPSYRECESGLPLTGPDMRWLWALYVADTQARLDPGASPLRAPDLTGSVPATIVAAEVDPLRDEAIAYAARLDGVGALASLIVRPGVPHLFLTWPLSSAAETLAAIGPDVGASVAGRPL